MSGITWKVLNDLLSYNPETGVLTYKVSRAGHIQRGKEAGSIHTKGYRHIRILDKLLLSHRVAWALHYNERPPEFIDHINGNGFDNSIKNLRPATLKQNSWNRKLAASNTSGTTGVMWNGKYWVARARKDGVSHYGGYYKDKESAITSVNKLKIELYGEFTYGGLRG